MPDPITETPTLDPAEHNAEVIRTQANQDAAGHSTVLTDADLKDTSNAIDKLAEEISKKNESAAEETTTTPEVTPGVKPATPADDEAAKAAEKAAADRKAESERAEGYFKDSPKLPANASPKSNEAFQSIKIKAAQEISAREQELEKLRKEKAELEEKLKTPIPPETEKEINDLREWRAKLDVEADPKFKEFDKTINGTREFIYAQLQANPNAAPALIEAIKKHGGPDMIKWDKIWEGLKDPTLQRIVESKIADIEMAKFNKAQAIKASKENIQQYVSERAKQFEGAAKAHHEATHGHLKQYLGTTLKWLAEKPIDSKADEPTRKAAEEHNTFVKQLQTDVMSALQDDSPEMRAMMIAGMAQLVYVQKQRDVELKAWESDKKALKEANETIEKYKKASVSRIRSNTAPSGGTPAPKTDEAKLFNTPATQALDDLMKDMQEKRAKASAMA